MFYVEMLSLLRIFSSLDTYQPIIHSLIIIYLLYKTAIRLFFQPRLSTYQDILKLKPQKLEYLYSNTITYVLIILTTFLATLLIKTKNKKNVLFNGVALICDIFILNMLSTLNLYYKITNFILKFYPIDFVICLLSILIQMISIYISQTVLVSLFKLGILQTTFCLTLYSISQIIEFGIQNLNNYFKFIPFFIDLCLNIYLKSLPTNSRIIYIFQTQFGISTFLFIGLLCAQQNKYYYQIVLYFSIFFSIFIVYLLNIIKFRKISIKIPQYVQLIQLKVHDYDSIKSIEILTDRNLVNQYLKHKYLSIYKDNYDLLFYKQKIIFNNPEIDNYDYYSTQKINQVVSQILNQVYFMQNAIHEYTSSSLIFASQLDEDIQNSINYLQMNYQNAISTQWLTEWLTQAVYKNSQMSLLNLAESKKFFDFKNPLTILNNVYVNNKGQLQIPCQLMVQIYFKTTINNYTARKISKFDKYSIKLLHRSYIYRIYNRKFLTQPILIIMFIFIFAFTLRQTNRFVQFQTFFKQQIGVQNVPMNIVQGFNLFAYVNFTESLSYNTQLSELINMKNRLIELLNQYPNRSHQIVKQNKAISTLMKQKITTLFPSKLQNLITFQNTDSIYLQYYCDFLINVQKTYHIQIQSIITSFQNYFRQNLYNSSQLSLKIFNSVTLDLLDGLNHFQIEQIINIFIIPIFWIIVSVSFFSQLSKLPYLLNYMSQQSNIKTEKQFSKQLRQNKIASGRLKQSQMILIFLAIIISSILGICCISFNVDLKTKSKIPLSNQIDQYQYNQKQFSQIVLLYENLLQQTNCSQIQILQREFALKINQYYVKRNLSYIEQNINKNIDQYFLPILFTYANKIKEYIQMQCPSQIDLILNFNAITIHYLDEIPFELPFRIKVRPEEPLSPKKSDSNKVYYSNIINQIISYQDFNYSLSYIIQRENICLCLQFIQIILALFLFVTSNNFQQMVINIIMLVLLIYCVIHTNLLYYFDKKLDTNSLRLEICSLYSLQYYITTVVDNLNINTRISLLKYNFVNTQYIDNQIWQMMHCYVQQVPILFQEMEKYQILSKCEREYSTVFLMDTISYQIEQINVNLKNTEKYSTNIFKIMLVVTILIFILLIVNLSLIIIKQARQYYTSIIFKRDSFFKRSFIRQIIFISIVFICDVIYLIIHSTLWGKQKNVELYQNVDLNKNELYSISLIHNIQLQPKIRLFYQSLFDLDYLDSNKLSIQINNNISTQIQLLFDSDDMKQTQVFLNLSDSLLNQLNQVLKQPSFLFIEKNKMLQITKYGLYIFWIIQIICPLFVIIQAQKVYSRYISALELLNQINYSNLSQKEVVYNLNQEFLM